MTVPTSANALSAHLLDLADFERLEARLIVELSPPLRPEDVQRCLVACVTRYQSATVHKAARQTGASVEHLLSYSNGIELAKSPPGGWCATVEPVLSCG